MSLALPQDCGWRGVKLDDTHTHTHAHTHAHTRTHTHTHTHTHSRTDTYACIGTTYLGIFMSLWSTKQAICYAYKYKSPKNLFLSYKHLSKSLSLSLTHTHTHKLVCIHTVFVTRKEIQLKRRSVPLLQNSFS